MNDEGFREIQLNGKQLVFLFMAATVVLVVTFLLGVMTGRSSPAAEPVMETAAGEVQPDAASEPPADTIAPSPSSKPGASVAPADAPPAGDDLSYANRLLRDEPPAETLKSPAPAPATKASPPPPQPKPEPPAASAAAEAKPKPTPAAPPQPAAQPASTRAAAATALDPSGPGFAVQVAISKDRREADSLAKELVAKGYPAFVMDPAKGAPAGIYRVRIGKYKTRKDAEEVAARLKTVEQFDPWIAR